MNFNASPSSILQRHHLHLSGRVQGVGMRPWLRRLAERLGLVGWVNNTPSGVFLEIEGTPAALAEFESNLQQHAPPAARITAFNRATLTPLGQESHFRVIDSQTDGAAEPCAPPDLAPCPACLAELFDPANRRYRYPFLSCTDCGPRYSLLQALPFDRERTAMVAFPLCPACQAEYDDPRDRRCHAQTSCCPDCGPRLSLLDNQGQTLAAGDAALRLAVNLLAQGRIVALKGVGGFQLLADAGNAEAVQTLRLRKQRPAKPFALLADHAMLDALCEVTPLERRWLNDTAAPIVLLERRATAAIAEAVAPGLPWLGVMLPTSPLHHLLISDFGKPLIATSGNRGGEPIAIDNAEAVQRLSGIADAFLLHDRAVLRPLDDSVLRIAADQALMLRRARGFTPEPIELARPLPPLLAMGGHLKNTVAFSQGRRVLLSQHLGDLDDALTIQQCAHTVQELLTLYGVQPHALRCDAHPDYASSRLAERNGLPIQRVPHHYAHALAVMAEHGLDAPCLAIAWDGIGLGADGHLWGGEFLRIDSGGFQRVASLWPLRLPGGEKAIKEPRRLALAALFELDRTDHLGAPFTATERATLLTMLDKGLNSPPCSSVGRLFDALASVLGLCHINQFEGQAAMLLEAAALTPSPLPKGAGQRIGCAEHERSASSFVLTEDAHGLPRLDWRPWLQAVIDQPNRDVGVIAADFHAALAKAAVRVATQHGLPRVILCGGCFQNRLLLELCVAGLRTAGFSVYWPQRVPPNDGGLALGQLYAAYDFQET